MSRFKIIPISCCVVCVHLTANGEYNDGEDTAERCLKGQAAVWSGNERYFVVGSDCEEGCTKHEDGEHEEFELGFSWMWCDGCEDTNGGDRYQMYVMIPLPE